MFLNTINIDETKSWIWNAILDSAYKQYNKTNSISKNGFLELPVTISDDEDGISHLIIINNIINIKILKDLELFT